VKNGPGKYHEPFGQRDGPLGYDTRVAALRTGRVLCMFRDPETNQPCQCNDFVITIRAFENLPGRLTEEDIVHSACGPRNC
jgi:hypothetical protein